MKLVLFILALICVVSCKKNNPLPTDGPGILMAHSWYPYQKQIVTIDSIGVTTRDSAGNSTTVNSVTHSDTSYITNQCLQQSSYAFQKNAVLSINDKCNPYQTTITTTWDLSATNVLGLPQSSNTMPTQYRYSYGIVTKIDNSQFTFTTVNTTYFFQTKYDSNNKPIITSDLSYISENTTYKAR